jgi:hypothetical protein
MDRVSCPHPHHDKTWDAADVVTRAALGRSVISQRIVALFVQAVGTRLASKTRADYRAGVLIQRLPHIKLDVSTKSVGGKFLGNYSELMQQPQISYSLTASLCQRNTSLCPHGGTQLARRRRIQTDTTHACISTPPAEGKYVVLEGRLGLGLG